MRHVKKQSGFTLIETLIGVALLSIISISLFRIYVTLLETFAVIKTKNALVDFVDERMEVVKNIAYANVGTVGGVPAGIIPAVETFVRDGLTFISTTTIRNIDDPFDGILGGVPNDTAPADYKLVEIDAMCVTCASPQRMAVTGRVAPKNLESASTNGALFVKAIDASGIVIPNTVVTIVNNKVSPAINITDVTNSSGLLQLVDTPPSFQSYQITVTKAGYSSDQTYATSSQNPNPTRPHATIAAQTVTQTTFAIDRVSQMNLSSVSQMCSAVSGTSATVAGAKLIGTSPDVPKYSKTTAFSGSALVLTNMEWDSYGMTFANSGYDVAGSIPNLPINLVPNATQNIKVILAPKTPNALLVTVQDNATLLPLSNATATVTRTGFSSAQTTGRGFLRQTDWSGGSGQSDFVGVSQYASDDGNVETASPAGDVKLKSTGAPFFAPSGFLISSTFDTGSASSFYNLTFAPGSQPVDTGQDSVRFQLATATTSTPTAWNFLGPDGTAGSFYTTGNTTISPVHNGDQFLRYKIYLSTASTTFTPTASDIAVTFASSCIPPGQVLFSGLAQNVQYTITIDRTGYTSQTRITTTDHPYKEEVFLMTP